jgi:hypothetical protein
VAGLAVGAEPGLGELGSDDAGHDQQAARELQWFQALAEQQPGEGGVEASSGGSVPAGGRSSWRRRQASTGASASNATAARACAMRSGGTPCSKATLAMIAEMPQQAPAATTPSVAASALARPAIGAPVVAMSRSG